MYIRTVHIDKKQTQLARAIILGLTEVAHHLIENGADINYQYEKGQSLVLLAILHEQGDIAEKLIDAKADVNTKDHQGLTPLFAAISNEKINVRISRKLIKAGADINATDDNGENALIKAAYYGRTEIIEILLDEGIDINYTNKNSYPALFAAAWENRIESLDLLIKRGAHINLTNTKESPLLGAVINNNIEMIKYLIDVGVDINFKNSEGNTILMFAVERGLDEITKLLLDNGADINLQNNNGINAISLTLLANENHILDMLISSNITFRINNNNLNTMLIFVCAIYTKNYVTLAKIIKDNKNTYIQEWDENHNLIKSIQDNKIQEIHELLTAHHDEKILKKAHRICMNLAIRTQRRDVFNEIIENIRKLVPQEVNGIDFFVSALFIALEIEDTYAIEKLIELGCNVNYVCRNMSMMDFALITKNGINIIQLIAAGANIDPKYNREIIKIFKESFANWNNAHTAAYFGNVNKIKEIKTNLFESKVSDKFLTPLDIAIICGHRMATEAILNKVKKKNQNKICLYTFFKEKEDQYLEKSLHLAIKARRRNIVKLLLSLGADPIITNVKGESAFDIATKSNNQRILSILNSHQELNVARTNEGISQRG